MKFSSVIVCDDIRRELGGKHTIIGTYKGNMVFEPQEEPKKSFSKQLGFYIQLEKESGDSDFNNFRGKILFISPQISEPKTLAKVEGTIDGSFTKGVVFDFVIPLNIPSEGSLKLNFIVLNNEDIVKELNHDLLDIEIAQTKQSLPA